MHKQGNGYAYMEDSHMETFTIPELHEFDCIESRVSIIGMRACIDDWTSESSKLLYLKPCKQLEKMVEPWNNSVTQDLMVFCLVIWTRIQYINAVVYEVYAVYAICLLLHNRHKELDT
jgi:hypothetical protein